MKIEICADSLDTVKMANQFGVARIELCASLSVGGLTPNFGLVESCVNAFDNEIHVMIRHKEGDFIYNENDIEIMKSDIKQMSDLGVAGVVFGCLIEERDLNLLQMAELVEASKLNGLEATCHRAFDFVNDPSQELENLIDLKVDRILTSGLKKTAEEGIDNIKDLVNLSDGRIEIMAGSGVNSSNANIIANTGVDAIHFTSHIVSEKSIGLGMGQVNLPDSEKIKSIMNLFK